MSKLNINRDRLLRAVGVFAEHAASDDERLIDALVAAGFERLESRMMSAFLPLAFGRVALERIGPMDFSETVGAKTRLGTWIQIPLRDVPVYGAALALARESYTNGIVPRAPFSAVATRSAEMNAVSDALDAGKRINGATLASALIVLSAEDLGYGSLWSRLWARLFG
jgi:hypothetical protein